MDGATINHYSAEVLSQHDYYPFGMEQPGRSYNGIPYPYAFNGKRMENVELFTTNIYDYGMRSYDARIGRFYSVDPLASKYLELSPYQFASNRPIDGIDRDGLEWYPTPIRDKNGNIDINPTMQMRRTEAQIGAGLLESAKGTVTGLWNTVRHPVNTAKNLWQAGTHPFQTAKAIKNHIVKEFQENPNEAIGKYTGDVLQLLIGGGLTKAFSKAKEVSTVTKAEEVAAKTSRKLLGRSVDAFWGKVFNYRHGGKMSAIEHIMYRHSYNSEFADVSKFLPGTSAKMIKRYVDQAIKYGKPIQGGFEYNFGRVIGTGSNEATATSLRVYIRDGWVRTAFPFSN